jgi:hypothetical protein
VAIRNRPTSPSAGDAAVGVPRPDNRLALLDQAFYAGHRAAGQKEVMQVVWGYEREVDLDALRRFHGNLAHGLLGRRIERSPLPFGRYRWVADGRPSDLDIAESARPRAEFGEWLDECARLPLDPESGPGWRLSVCPFTDGSTAVTLVMSHYVIDGIGGVVAVVMAILGDTSGQGYPPPRSRPLLRAVVEDVVGVARDAPGVVRALGKAVEPLKQARLRRSDGASDSPRPITTTASGADRPADVPGIWIRLNMDEWEARAAALGGSGSTMATALTAKLGQHLGRRRGDTVNMLLVVNDRQADDTRAVAVSFARFSIDPTQVTTDLRGARAAVKQALKTLRETPDPSAQLAPLTPFTPKRAWREMVDSGLDDPDPPAVLSSLGEVGPVVIRPDGNPCDYAYLRGVDQLLTQRRLEQMGGQLQLFYGCGEEANKVGLHIRAYQPGCVTTKQELRELAARTLAEFDLAGIIE